jgi:hypothetical protein
MKSKVKSKNPKMVMITQVISFGFLLITFNLLLTYCF